MPRKIVQVGNALLAQACAPLSVADIGLPKTKQLIGALKHTLLQVGGVGMAAPQIGSNKQVIVIGITPTKYRPHVTLVPTYIAINPVIEWYGKQQSSEYEGCFSVAHASLFAKVSRPATIKVSYLDETGTKVSKRLAGLEAVVFQHEVDHLNATVFLQRNVAMNTLINADDYIAMKEKLLKAADL